MSSGFVSGGTTEQPLERSDEWLKAQQEIEAQRRRKEDEGRQESGKSLYEVLEQNKAAKQEAFEESIRLKNQFRTLDDDEIEFLDSVLESTRAKEQALKKETAEQLSLFREQQETADRALSIQTEGTPENGDEGSSKPIDDTSWVISGRKRKRTKDNEILRGIKARRSSSTNDATLPDPHSPSIASPPGILSEEKKEGTMVRELSTTARGQQVRQKQALPELIPKTTERKIPKPPAQPNLGLGDYSSDDD